MERMTIRPITGHLRTEKSHFLTSFGSPCKVKKTLGTIVCDGIMMMNTSDHNERASSPITSLASVLIARRNEKKGRGTCNLVLILSVAAIGFNRSRHSSGHSINKCFDEIGRKSSPYFLQPLPQNVKARGMSSFVVNFVSQSHRCSMGLRSGL